jgi:hypothetical protein
MVKFIVRLLNNRGIGDEESILSLMTFLFGWLRGVVKKSVVVHTVDGISVRGVLFGVYRDCIVLIHAEYLGRESAEKVDGEVVIPRRSVSWMQVIGEVAP